MHRYSTRASRQISSSYSPRIGSDGRGSVLAVQRRTTSNPSRHRNACAHLQMCAWPRARFGVWWDTGLRREANIRRMVAKARQKVDAILRSRRSYSTWDLMGQYKTYVFSLLEGNSGVFYHALDAVLEPLDKLQASFLREVGLTAEESSCSSTLHHFEPVATSQCLRSFSNYARHRPRLFTGEFF